MKKSIGLVLLCALFLFVSCHKDKDSWGEYDGGTEQVSPVVRTVEIQAAFSEPDAKAGLGALDNGIIPFEWKTGDKIRAFYSGSKKVLSHYVDVIPYANDPRKAILKMYFSEEDVPDKNSGEIVLLYPGNVTNPEYADDGIIFTVPLQQIAGDDGLPYNVNNLLLVPCVANIGKADEVFQSPVHPPVAHFMNPFTLVAFTLDGSMTDVTKVSLKGNSNEYLLGEYAVNPGQGNLSLTYTQGWVDETLKTASITENADGTQSLVPGKKYYMLVKIKDTDKFSNGFTVTMTRKISADNYVKQSRSLEFPFERSHVKDLGVLSGMDAPFERTFTYGQLGITSGVPMRFAAQGGFLYISNGTSVYALERATGRVLKKVNVPDGLYVHSLTSDHAGNLIIAGTCTHNTGEQFDIYALTSMEAEPKKIYNKASNDVYGSTYGNVRVFGDIRSKAVLTYFAAGGGFEYFQAVQFINGQKTTEHRGQIGLITGDTYSVNNGCVMPLGDDLSDGIAAVAYAAPFDVYYTSDYSTWRTLFDDGTVGVSSNISNYPCLSAVKVGTKLYLGYVRGTHSDTPKPEIVILDVTDKSKVTCIYNAQLTTGDHKADGGVSSEILLANVNGNLWAYVTDASFDIIRTIQITGK